MSYRIENRGDPKNGRLAHRAGPSPAAPPPAFCRGASSGRRLVALIGLLAVAGFLAVATRDLKSSGLLGAHALVAIGVIGVWRWGWGALHGLRAVCYRYFVFPRIRRAAERAVLERGPIPNVAIVATTYREHPWITRTVFASVFRELASLSGLRSTPKVIVVVGCHDDEVQIRRVYSDCLASLVPEQHECWPPDLFVLRGDRGKRCAIADGLTRLAECNLGDDSVVVMMDGDTAVRPGLLRKTLSVFRGEPRVAAVTTNEEGVVAGPAWFAEWISLRFGQRHLSMCSLSLSRRVLCLTGRLSAFRGSLATHPAFVNQIRNDHLTSWLFGEYGMLSGDDKSTWYWLASHGYEMLYVPDAMATTYEVVAGNSMQRAMANLQRWSGNSLRHNQRAIGIGPSKLRLFPWLCVIDQQLSMWTILIGPITAILACLYGRFEVAAAYLVWVLASRTVRVLPAFRHGRRVSAYYVPLQVFTDWLGALLKTWIRFHPAKQRWFNRGNRSLDSTRHTSFRLVRTSVATYLYALSVSTLVLAVGVSLGFIPIVRDAPLVFGRPTVVRSFPSGGQPTTSRQRVDEKTGRQPEVD